MRKTSLSLFALLFVFACSPRPADHTAAPSAGQVVISLVAKAGGTFGFTVAPPSISISIRNQDQIEWKVSDNTDWPLTDVQITKFQGDHGKTDPFGDGGTFSIPSVSAGHSVSKPSGPAKPGSQDSYTYIVTGTLTVNGNPTPVTLDPRLVVGD
jgi:hypothetical protein